MRTSLLFSLTILSFVPLTNCDLAAQVELEIVTHPVDKQEIFKVKLTPELSATQKVQATYIGMNIYAGNGVLRFPPEVGHDEAVRKLKALPEVKDVLEVDRGRFAEVDELIVAFETGFLMPSDVFMGMPVEARYEQSQYLIARAKGGITWQLLEKLPGAEGVEFVEPNYKFPLPWLKNGEEVSSELGSLDTDAGQQAKDSCRASTVDAVPNDTRYQAMELWGLGNVRAESAWADIHDTQVVVAVIDTGVNHKHPDLDGSLWSDSQGNHGKNYIKSENPNDPMDTYGHGTHIAGIIAAEGNNALGVVGVAWKAHIMGIRVFRQNTAASVGSIPDAIRFAVDNGAKVINMSFGFSPSELKVEQAVSYAESQGVLLVACAGNWQGRDNDTWPWFPGSYPNSNVIAVAAIDCNENLERDSSIGSNSVDLAAPGSKIWSTVLVEKYDDKDGTSQATAFVTGAAVLTLAKCGNLGPADVSTRILRNVRPLPSLSGKVLTGGTLCLEFLARDCAAAPVLCN